MLRAFLVALFAVAFAAPALAMEPFPPGFHTQEITTNGVTIHVRVRGHGPAVLMLRGFGDPGHMGAPLARVLAVDHTVVAPDLRGMGLSSHPPDGYRKTNQAEDMIG